MPTGGRFDLVFIHYFTQIIIFHAIVNCFCKILPQLRWKRQHLPLLGFVEGVGLSRMAWPSVTYHGDSVFFNQTDQFLKDE